MTDLLFDVEHLKRAVAVPGTFATLFPETTDDDLVDTLADGLAEAQLFGFLTEYELVGQVVTPDLTLPQRALVVLFASSRILSNQVSNLLTGQRFVAGPAEFEQERSAQVLTERLRYVQGERDKLLERAKEDDYYTEGLWMADQSFVRAVSDYGYGPLHRHPLDAWGG